MNLKDCGPACLYMVSKFYGKNLSIEKLRDLTQIDKEGVNLYGLSDAAEKIGFRTFCAKITFNELITEVRLPCIVHWEQNHFVVVAPSSNRKKIQIADPAQGIIYYSKEEFCKFWISTKGDNGEELGVALIIQATPIFFEQEDEKENKLTWSVFTKYLWQYKRYIVQIFMALGLSSLFQLLFPFLTQSIIDTGINTNNLPFIYLVLIAQFMLVFSRVIVEFIRSRLLLYVSTHINVSILSDFWIKLMKLPISFFDMKMTGDIIQRLGDHRRIEAFLTGSTLNVIFSLFNLVIFSFVLLLYNKTIFLIFWIASILYFFWIKIFLKYRRQLDYKRFAIASKENSATMQLILGMHEIKLNNAEQSKRWQWENLQTRLFKLSFKGLSLSQYQQLGVFLINESKNIIIIFIVAKSVLDGQLTLGAMLAVQYIIGQLNSPVEQLIGFVQSAQDAKISLERLNEIHQLDNEEPNNKSLISLLPSSRTIEVNNLSYTYPGAGNEAVLNNVQLKIPEGKVTAIVGVSGSGKTTLLKLLLKFYENYNGEIKIGESNLKNISHKFWRKHCGSVMQDGFIFSESIAKNIAVTDEIPNYDKLIHSCKIANILSYIEGLPLGFNTKIGAEGNGISAGQKQRILIARAVYKNPEYIFFDEATNSLDSNNEETILDNLQYFFRDKTVVIVAHRLSTVRNSDNIVVLHGGMISENGSHEDLITKRGRYFELVKNQLELEG